ncbi:MAG: hypothetical protein R3C49_00680 [Planctomycetaceae bacterium]
MVTTDDVNQLIDEIQRALAATTEPTEEELIDLAARHEDVVEATAARLREVEKLLNKGLRSEAIALAEQAPNLNDLATALDFPEFEIWNDFLLQFGIQPIRELPVDIAAELNDAYSISAPLERLLQRYRTQSLARAPLPDRIDTLRQLVVEDTANPGWKNDLQKFEAHRLEQLKKELQVAIKGRDLSAVAVLDQELNAVGWSVNVPPSVKKMARDAHVQLRQASARQELQTLSHQLSDAYADFDRPVATRLQQRFLALAEIAEPDATDAIYDIAGPALDWLNEEQTKEAAEADFVSGKAQIESALDRETTIEELERLYAMTVRHGHSLPTLLENRLADRIESLKSAASRKRMLQLASIVSVCLAGTVAVVFLVQLVTFQRAVAGHADQATQMLTTAKSTGDLQPLDDYFAAITAEDPRYMEQPELLGLKEQLEALRSSESGRHSQLDQLIGNALNLISDPVRWENLSPAETLLKDAQSLARNEAEEARILHTQGQVQQARLSLQRKVDEAFETDQALLVEQIDTLPKDSLTGYPEVLKQLAEMETRSHVSAELKTALAPLKARVSQQQVMVDANMKMAASLQKITQAVGLPVKYRQQLLEFTQNHPGSKRSEDMLAVIASDLPIWEGIGRWNSLRRRFQAASVQTISPQDAASLIADYDQFQKTSGPYPGPTGVDDRVMALTAIAARGGDEDSDSSSEQIERMFAPRTVSDAWLVETADGDRYYATRAPQVEGSSVRFSFYTTTTGTQTDTKVLALGKVPFAPQRTEEQWKSPQMQLTERLKNELLKRVSQNFEDGILFGADVVLKDGAVDSILKIQLLERLLRIGADGSVFVRRNIEPSLEKIAETGVSKLTNWAVPGDTRAKDERRKADQFFQQHGPAILAGLQMAVEQTAQPGFGAIGPEMEGVGWLHRNLDGQWVVALRTELNVRKPTTLLAVGRLGADDAARFYPVATAEHSTIGSLPADLATDGKEGHPVYLSVEQ